MIKKESRQFNISVEGINCEKMYFEHLAKLINSSDATYNLKVDPRKMTSMQYAKRNAHRPIEKWKGNKKLPYIHVQDIEDYYSEFHRKKFYGMIDEMRDAEDQFWITYELGYSNYTFELWMLLHVADMSHAVLNRKAYLAPPSIGGSTGILPIWMSSSGRRHSGRSWMNSSPWIRSNRRPGGQIRLWIRMGKMGKQTKTTEALPSTTTIRICLCMKSSG